MPDKIAITLDVNGKSYDVNVEPRRSLADVLREDCGLTGTHLGCEHGVCGACTVLVDGRPVRACLMFGVQAEGKAIRTVEGLADGPNLSALQTQFADHSGAQCGYCTPGFLIAATDLLERNANPTRDQIAEALSGNLCRCTGYQQILDAVESAARIARGEPAIAPRPPDALP